MIPNLTPKSKQWLHDLVLNIENSVQLSFPDYVKREIRFEYLDPLDAFEKVVEVTETLYNKQFGTQEKVDTQEKVEIKKGCENGGILGLADSVNNKVYIVKKSLENVVKEDLIEDYIFTEPDFIRYKLSKPKEKEKMTELVESLLLVHELGHILFDYLSPKMNIKFKTSTARNLWDEGRGELNEAFADYIMIRYYNKVYGGIDRKFKLVIELLIGNREMWVGRKKHIDNMFSSDNPLGYIKERLKKRRP